MRAGWDGNRGAGSTVMKGEPKMIVQVPMNEPIIGPKGQITISAEIRVKLGIQPGDRVLFTEVEGGFSISKQTKKAVFKKQPISNSLPTTHDPLK